MSAEKYMERARAVVMKWRGIPGGADIEPMIAALCAEIEQETREACARHVEEGAALVSSSHPAIAKILLGAASDIRAAKP